MTFQEWRKEAEQMLTAWHHDDPACVDNDHWRQCFERNFRPWEAALPNSSASAPPRPSRSAKAPQTTWDAKQKALRVSHCAVAGRCGPHYCCCRRRDLPLAGTHRRLPGRLVVVFRNRLFGRFLDDHCLGGRSLLRCLRGDRHRLVGERIPPGDEHGEKASSASDDGGWPSAFDPDA
jgi:hypothetical protein